VRGYRLNRFRGGYVDQRDYITDLALRGLERIQHSEPVDGISFNLDKLINLRHRTLKRNHVVKVDLKAIDLRSLDYICNSVYNMDVYDCLSFLIMIGQDEVNGGITYSRDDEHEKIYS
jgi:hypothetical protein